MTDPTMRYDAVIFDCDGVLVEPTNPEVHREAVREAFRSFDVEPVSSETVDQLVEITGDERDQLSTTSVEEICTEFGLDPDAFWREREALAARAQLREVEAGRKALYADTEVVERLGQRDQGVPLGVISNNQHQLIVRMLEYYDLTEAFQARYGREPSLVGLARRKPNPFYARQVVEDFGAEAPILVGDSAVDIRTADRLGIDSVFLRRDHRLTYDLSTDPTYEISRLTELPAVLER